MTARRRGGKIALGAAGLVLLLAVAAAALAPRWIRLDPVRRKIEAAASSALAGEVRIGEIDLSWLPRPGVVLRQVAVSVPGSVRGTVRSVSVDPAIGPLLRGKVLPRSLRVERPDLTVEVPEAGGEAKAAPSVRSSAPVPPVLPALAMAVPGATFELEGARLAVTRAGRLVARADDLGARFAVTPAPPAGVHVFVSLSGRSISLARTGRSPLTLEGLRLEGAADLSEGRIEATLSRLSLDAPHLSVEGSLRTDAAARRAEATAKGTGLDVTALRPKLLAFLGDEATVRSIFEIFRRGTLTTFTFASGGTTPADLGVFDRMSIRATLADGEVRIESAGLTLEEARGDVSVEKSVLSAEGAAARIGPAQVDDGSVRVGLASGDETLRVSARVRTELPGVPAILARAIRTPSFREELARVGVLSGRAEGRVTLENRGGALRTVVALPELRLAARHGRLPWPVEIRRAGFFYDGERLGVTGLSGTVGASTLSGLTARLRLGPEAAFEQVSGEIRASLDDLFPFLASRPGTEALRSRVRDLRGTLALSVSRLTGPVSEPKSWDYEASGALSGVLLRTPLLPGPLEADGGTVRIDGTAIRASGVAARILDAALTVSGSLDGYRGEMPKVDLTATGEVGGEALRWGWERARLPADFRPVAPLALRDLRVGLPGSGAFSLEGSIGVREGIRVDVDVAGDGGGTDLRRIAIADKSSDAVISLRNRRSLLSASFEGRLGAPTVENLFAKKREREGKVEGTFRVTVPREHSGSATAEGNLLVSDFDVPTPVGQAAIERLELRGAGSRVEIVASDVALDDERVSVTGNATFRDEGLILGLEAKTAALTWEAIERALDRRQERTKTGEEAVASAPAAPAANTSSRSLAVLGDIRVSIGSFGWGKREWKPVLAGVRIAKGSTTITVKEARTCGVSTTGEARLFPGGRMAIRAQVASEGPDVAVPLACFGLEDLRMSGEYEAWADVSAEGPPSELLRRLHGPYSVRAWNGTIGKANVLTKILGALNATSVFSGKAPTFLAKSMGFSKLVNEGDLGEGRAVIREAALVTPSFTMAAQGTVGLEDGALDLSVLSHPFSTADRIIGFIPVLRYVLGGDFLSVAARVSGTAGKPEVRVTAGRDVGKGVVNILERTVKYPVHVFTPAEPPPK
jgi:hypothetical protein